MIIVYLNNTTGKILRPSPYVSIAFNSKRHKGDYLGGDYSITLTGTILASGGSPFQDGDLDGRLQANSSTCTEASPGVTNKPIETNIADNPAKAILRKQEAIRQLFGRDGQKMEIVPVNAQQPRITCFPNVESVSFDVGAYINTCKYTINLTAPILYDHQLKPLSPSIPLSRNHDNEKLNSKYGFTSGSESTNPSASWTFPSGLVEDYNETWAIEIDDSFFLKTPTTINGTKSVPRCYRLTRNVTATGKTYYKSSGRYEGWKNAKDFITENIIIDKCKDPTEESYSTFFPQLASGSFGWELLNLNSGYQGFNHVRTENIDKTAGTYSIADTWLLTSGNYNTIESYNISANSSAGSPFTNITLNGKIKGLYKKDETMDKVHNTLTTLEAFTKAKTEYERMRGGASDITDPIQIVLATGSIFYQRASSITALALNPEPVSTSVNINKALGEIEYTIVYDNRPMSLFQDVLSDSITITDTYPGDIYAMMPTLNRNLGPLFQYMGGISQYERSLSIDLVVSHAYLGTDDAKKLNGKGWLMKSPSKGPLQAKLDNLIAQVCPKSDPNIRRYVLNPITESWDPKNGRYSMNISWVYEIKQ
jgi:hypothetical protein